MLGVVSTVVLVIPHVYSVSVVPVPVIVRVVVCCCPSDVQVLCPSSTTYVKPASLNEVTSSPALSQKIFVIGLAALDMVHDIA